MSSNNLPLEGRLRRHRRLIHLPHFPSRPSVTVNEAPQQKHSLIAILSGPYDPQITCPLFTTIPPEIRSIIFNLATDAYDVKDHPYPETAYYSTPGYSHPHRIDTALLATCRRIYTETHNLPVSRNEHTFWCASGRGPPGLRFCDNPTGYFNRFTEEQKAAVVRVHFLTQLCWLEGASFIQSCNALATVNPKVLKITIRHADWWFWESNHQLHMKSHWKDAMQVIPGLQLVEVELQTIERDQAQMEAIAQEMVKWKIPQTNSPAMVATRQPVQVKRYMGQSAYGVNGGEIYYSIERKRWTGRADFLYPLAYVSTTVQWVPKDLVNR